MCFSLLFSFFESEMCDICTSEFLYFVALAKSLTCRFKKKGHEVPKKNPIQNEQHTSARGGGQASRIKEIIIVIIDERRGK
jgi:hypothetical protein